MEDVRVLITMDVEPVRLDPRWAGPADVESSEKIIRAYWESAARQGYPVSFFIHPEIAQQHYRLFQGLEREGACLGLHIHATKFQHPLWEYEFGHYSAEDQAAMLGDGKEQWAMALGRAPAYFRPGAFSANDATFPTLAATGFRGGSVSMPGCVWPERYCVWAGAEADPHRANRAFRHVRGDLKFANIPLSVDFKSPRRAPGVRYYQDLRPSAEGVDMEKVLRNIVERIAEAQPRVPVIQMATHNDQGLLGGVSESRRRYEMTMRLIEPLCAEAGLRAMGATVEEVVDLVLSYPPSLPLQWHGKDDVELVGAREET